LFYLVTTALRYCLLCFRLVPDKLFRDWTDLFLSGKPLYDEQDVLTETGVVSEEQVLADERYQILADSDFNEYRVSTEFCATTYLSADAWKRCILIATASSNMQPEK
jgi:hypothetical protein